MLVCALLVHIAHETAGAARIRHSLRPLFSEGESYLQTSGAMRREIAGAHPVVIARLNPPSIPETSMIEPRSRGVLDHSLLRVMTAFVTHDPRNDGNVVKTPCTHRQSQNNPPYDTTKPCS